MMDVGTSKGVADQMLGRMANGGKMETYLFELLDVYVQLAPKFSLGPRECGDLGIECS